MSTVHDACWIDEDDRFEGADIPSTSVSDKLQASRQREMVNKRRLLEARLEQKRLEDEFGDIFERDDID